MFHPIYQIELRQMEVKGLNARHYFWVLKKNLPGGGTRVLGELHGRPADPKTGKPKSFSLGGDRLKFFKYDGERFYNQSRKLPFAIADIDHKENILRRWGQGIRAGGLVNKTGKYSLWGTNSNAVAKKLGEWMGFKVQRIVDLRVDAPQPFVPGLTTDIFAGSAGQGPVSGRPQAGGPSRHHQGQVRKRARPRTLPRQLPHRYSSLGRRARLSEMPARRAHWLLVSA